MITLEVKVASVMFLLRMPHFLHAFSQVGNDCSSFPSVISFSRLVTNHVLEGRVISTVHVTSDQECQMKCILSEMCDSFNLGPQTISRLYPCEILDQRSSRKVIKREQWKFRAGWCRTSPCLNGGTCFVVNGRPLCVCAKFWEGATCNVPQHKTSCSEWKALKPLSVSGFYFISPGYQRGLTPFLVYCDMTDKNGVGVTVIGHDSEKRTLVNGCDPHGCYSRDVHYLNASLLQLSSLAALSSHCEQFIKYECVDSSLLFRGWWVSHNGIKMNYWGGAAPGSGKCACGMNKTCYDSTKPCNCNANIPDVMLEDSGLLTDKTALPVSQLRFGDTGGTGEQGWHTLGKLYCYGVS